jgi:hypothetical protein
MTMSTMLRWAFAGFLPVTPAACSGGENEAAAPVAPARTAETATAPPATITGCPLTIEQVTAAAGAPMTRTDGECLFFAADGRDTPRVYYVVHNPMVCNRIAPSDLGFTEVVEGLPARAAYVNDQLDGAHVLVCRNDGTAFDIVVEIRNDKSQNRETAIALAKQVLTGR